MNTTLEKNKECIDTCNQLLRGELSAVETYNRAIDKFANEAETPTLRRIRDEHSDSVAELRQNVISMGGVADTDSGAWGDFATAVQATANFFGDDSAVSSLLQGEKHGKREYEDAIEKDSTMAACRDLMRNQLLPRVCRHIETLENLS